MTNPEIVEVIKARLEGCRCHRFKPSESTGNRCGGCEHDARCLAEIEGVRRERDEARREICHTKKRRLITHLDYARKRGWDCFKETL